ncbi:MAG: DUF86 domain-containing protein [Bacteroidales bacterium]|jgi:uncharacterized protein with HEPN domain|nr:DUF86 domain-containing protein [Bacteroidales bacterium]
MKKEIKTWLEDIKQSIEEIELFLSPKRNFIEFQNDLKTRKAVERNIEIIGEAVNRILKVDPSFKITNARRIVDTRNRISHGYDTISIDIIWAIAVKDLKNLYIEIKKILEE